MPTYLQGHLQDSCKTNKKYLGNPKYAHASATANVLILSKLPRYTRLDAKNFKSLLQSDLRCPPKIPPPNPHSKTRALPQLSVDG